VFDIRATPNYVYQVFLLAILCWFFNAGPLVLEHLHTHIYPSVQFHAAQVEWGRECGILKSISGTPQCYAM